MTWYPFRRQVAWNRDGAAVQSGAGAIYAVTDTGFTNPLTVRGVGGGATMTTVTIEDFLTREFEAQDHVEVYWKSGTAPPVWLFSAVGMRDDAAAARQAAQAAAAAAFGPTDETAAALFDLVTSEFRTRLDERYATKGALDDVAASAATTEDLFLSVPIVPQGVALSNSAASSFPVFVAPFPLRIISAALLTWSGSAIATSDTAYWRTEIRKQTAAGVVTTIANKTTRTTAHATDTTLPAGSALTPRAPWTFDTAAFVSPTLAAGEVFAAALYPTGTPTALGAPIILNVGCRPL